jgi:hypothetical protein
VVGRILVDGRRPPGRLAQVRTPTMACLGHTDLVPIETFAGRQRHARG